MKTTDSASAIALGRTHAGQDDWEHALEAFDEALHFEPSNLEAACLRADALARLDRWADAAESYRQALALDPGQAQVLNNLGVALGKLGKHHEAIAAYSRALAIDPQHANAYFNLGKLAAKLNQLDTASLLFQQALDADPNHAYAYHEMGSLLERQGSLKEAADAYRQSVRLDPTRSVRENLARVLTLLGDPAGLEQGRTLIAEQPDNAEAHWSYGMALLLHGHYQEGWEHFEWRTQIPRFAPYHGRFAQPRWAGEALNGRTILVYAEQGHGDTLLFLRYLPVVQALGGKVVFEMPPLLLPLLRETPGAEICIAYGDPRPHFHTHASLMSLPYLTKVHAPPQMPFLPTLQSLQPSAQTSTATYKVGLAWSGNPKHQRDHLRSTPLLAWKDLTHIGNVTFTSLQALPLNPADLACKGLFDFAAECDDMDFAQLAEVIEDLDLVISVDTAVAHLAGVMGKNVWVALSNVMDWRWGMDESTTPWYPSARLFRQTVPNDWTGVVTSIGAALRDEVQARSPQQD